MGGPNTGRPPVSASCTQGGELTGDNPTHLREDMEERVGSPLAVSIILSRFSWQEHLMTRGHRV